MELVVDKKREIRHHFVAFIRIPVHDMPVVSYTPYLYSSVKKLGGGIQTLKPLNEQTEHNAMYAFHTLLVLITHHGPKPCTKK